jgi:hypothetical protein
MSVVTKTERRSTVQTSGCARSDIFSTPAKGALQHFLKIGEVEVSQLAAQVAAHPELRDQHTIRKTAPNTPHSGMSDIWVRYNDVKKYEESGDYRTFNDAHVPVWYPAWTVLPSLKPIVLDQMAATEGEMLGGVLITRIPPGHGIAPHTDDGWHVQYYDKFYVCIQNDPGQPFGASMMA